MSDDTTSRVVEIVTSVLQVKEKDPAKLTRANLPEWDSLSQIEILFSVEEEFDTAFDPDGLGELDSVAALVAALTAPS